MARGFGMNKLIASHDISALTILFVIVVIGLWPIALLFVVLGFISSIIKPDGPRN